MKSRKRKLQNRQDNEGDAELYNSWLFPILNGEPPEGRAIPAACKRVLRLLLDLQLLEKNRRTLKPLARDRCEGTPYGLGFIHKFRDSQAEDLYRSCAELVESINAQLSRYKCSPEILFRVDDPIKLWQTWDERTESIYHESLAAWTFLNESAEGRINRFRRCVHCARWFYAITDHQKYCAARCRVKEHSQGEEFRKKRARYMREKYRPALREYEASAKRLAGREGGK